MKAPSKVHKFIEENGYKYSKYGYCKFPFEIPVPALIELSKVSKEEISLDWTLCYPYADEGAFGINPDVFEFLWLDGSIRNGRSFKNYEYLYNPKDIELIIEILKNYFNKWESIILDNENIIEIYDYVLDPSSTIPDKFDYLSELDIIRAENFLRVIKKAAYLNILGKFNTALNLLENHPVILKNARRYEQKVFCKVLSDAQNNTILFDPNYLEWAKSTGFAK